MTLRRLLLTTACALGTLCVAAPAFAQQHQTPAPRPVTSVEVRTELSPGLRDAGHAERGMALEASVAPPPGFFDPEALFTVPQTEEEVQALMARWRTNPPRYAPLSLAASDLAMKDGILFQGNFNGFNAYDTRGGGEPRLVMSVVCPGGQGDLSIHGNLLFMSVEQGRARIDCGTAAAEGDVNADRFRGIRIFDITDMSAPRQVAAVQTCRGSHTHTLVPSDDPNVVYLYNSGLGGVRKSEELSICSDGQPDTNADTALYSIDVIRVPLNAPQDAAIIDRPRIFADRETGAIAGLWTGGQAGVASQQTAPTNHCHDITVFPELNLAAGACSGNGILLDISDPARPSRVSDLFDPDMSYWHSATFNNAGDQVVFTDEWGGGMAARCQATDPTTWGANLIASTEGRKLEGEAFFKLPAIQGAHENCVAHNGNVIPVPGRDLMVQAWYQGGVSVMDFTNPRAPREVAYFDRGPIGADGLVMGGVWSAYWFNGRIYSSEIARGLDVLKLVPSDELSAAEIAAAEAVQMATINPQTQTRVQWADTPDVAQAYLDQLKRANAIDAALAARIGERIAHWRHGMMDAAASAALAVELTTAAGAEGADARRLNALAGVLSRVAG